MSWIITRHLCKSGGNNIRHRIGQYNKFSYSGYNRCKKISKHIFSSRKYKHLIYIKQKNRYNIVCQVNNSTTRLRHMGSLMASDIFYLAKKNMGRWWEGRMIDAIVPECIRIITNNKRYSSFDELLMKHKRTLLGYILRRMNIRMDMITSCLYLPDNHSSVKLIRNYLLHIKLSKVKIYSNSRYQYVNVSTCIENFMNQRKYYKSKKAWKIVGSRRGTLT